MSEQPPLSSSQHEWPDIFIGRDEHGVPQYRSLANPANLSLEALNFLGSPAIPDDKTGFFKRGFSLASSAFQPVISTTLPRLIATVFGRPTPSGRHRHCRGIAYFDPAITRTPEQQLRAILGQTAARYAPVKANPAGLLEFFGIGNPPAAWRDAVERTKHHRNGVPQRD